MQPVDQLAVGVTHIRPEYTNAEYREMFLAAIKVQEGIIEHAQRAISRYQEALGDMAESATLEIVN